MTVRFTVETTFDLPGRGGILAEGTLHMGVVTSGMSVVDEAGRTIQVIGVEFLTPAQRGTNRRTLVIDRRDAAGLRKGTVLTDPS